MRAAEERYLAIGGMKQVMFDFAAAGHVILARGAEERLTKLEEMTDEEFAAKYPDDDSDIA